MNIIISTTVLPILSLLHDFTHIVVDPTALPDILVLSLRDINLSAVH